MVSEWLHGVIHGEVVVYLINHTKEACHLRYVGGSWEILNRRQELSRWSNPSLYDLRTRDLHHILPDLEIVAVHDQASLTVDLQQPAHHLDAVLQGLVLNQVVIYKCNLVLDPYRHNLYRISESLEYKTNVAAAEDNTNMSSSG